MTLTPLTPTELGSVPLASVTVTGSVAIGTGDEQHLFAATTASKLDIRVGTAASPDTSQNPALKVTRTMMFADATFGSSAAPEQNSAILGIGVSKNPGAYQPIGVLGISQQESTLAAATGDALGVMGLGHAVVDANYAAYGVYGVARRTHDTPFLQAFNAQVQNFGAEDAYAANGNFKCAGSVIQPSGTANSGAGYVVQRYSTDQQFDVGIAFPQSGVGSPVASSGIRIDCDCPKAAISIKDGNDSGTVGNPLLIGLTERAGTQANAYFVLQSSNGSNTAPMMWWGSGSGSHDHFIHFANSSGLMYLCVAGTAGHFTSSAGAGDFVFKVQTSDKNLFIGGHYADAGIPGYLLKVTNGHPDTGSGAASGALTLCKTSAMALGFWGTTPAVRPSGYTQTYSTADKTHAARTAAAVTNNTAGTISTTLAALPDPADAPASADALRDDLVANVLPVLRNWAASLADQHNKLNADSLDTAQVVNAVIDDDQLIGFRA